jgi:hypothetical protein
VDWRAAWSSCARSTASFSPAAGLEDGEAPEEAVAREALEEHRGSVVAFDPRVEEGASLLHAEALGRHDELHQSADARADTVDKATAPRT